MSKLEELKLALECVDEEGVGNANFIALMQENLPTLTAAAAELLKVFLEEGVPLVPPYDDIDKGYVILDKLGM